MKSMPPPKRNKPAPTTTPIDEEAPDLGTGSVGVASLRPQALSSPEAMRPDLKKLGTVDSLNRSTDGLGTVEVKALNKPASKDDDNPTIKVCVRVRPFIKEEISGERSGGKCECCIQMPTKTAVHMVGREEARQFEFDRCYWSHSKEHPLYATQETLQAELGETMLEHALNGFNNCIFAYGQTGSGKSYSVLGGKDEDRGLLPRVVEGLFRHFTELEAGSVAKTFVSFMEIYNEQICDLLAEEKDKDKKLDVKQHPVLGTVIPGLTEAPVSNGEEVLALVEYGTTMRHVSATKMNAASSRSHCIFSFKTSVNTEHSKASVASQTHLVDLAGSERAGRTKATGDRLKEGAAINQSLSTLARVISELAKSSGKKKGNPPFRDSKLTYILKESLCGNSKTVMMAAISPSMIDYDETLSTMKFAQSVKQVQTKAVANRVSEADVEGKLRKELEELRLKVQEYEGAGLGRRGGGYAMPSMQEIRGMPMPGLDEEQAELARKKLEQQEQLCQLYGKTWEELLEEERKRMARRSDLMTSGALWRMGGDDPYSPRRRDVKEKDDGSSASSTVDSEDQTPQILLVAIDEEEDEDCRTTLLPAERSEVLIVGPGAEGDRGAAAMERAAQLTVELQQCRRDVESAQAVLHKRHPGADQVELQVGVVIVSNEQELRGELLIRARHMHPGRGSKDGTYVKDPLEDEEWLTWNELHRRLAWIRCNNVESSYGYARLEGTTPATVTGWAAWKAAAQADSEGTHAAAELALKRAADAKFAEEKAKLVDDLEEVQAELLEARLALEEVEAASRERLAKHQGAVEEMHSAKEDLASMKQKAKQELAAMQEELARVQGKLKEAQRAAAEMRADKAELEELRQRVAAAKDKADRESAARIAAGLDPLPPSMPTLETEKTPLPANLGPMSLKLAGAFDKALDAIMATQTAVDRRHAELTPRTPTSTSTPR